MHYDDEIYVSIDECDEKNMEKNPHKDYECEDMFEKNDNVVAYIEKLIT